MKKILCLLTLILIASNARAQLSEQAEISVLTCGSYDELYSAFGHSAFRIHDPVNNINVTCNYGTFHFNPPLFYLNFALGNNIYSLSIQDYQRFEDVYIYQNRFIHEQVLNLTQEQKQKLFAYLEWNAKPENASYSYDYFYDNCSTKIRDVLWAALGRDAVVFDESHITTDYTIRQLTDFYLKNLPWGDLGIDICLGLPMDKKAAPLEYMFLPDYVESALDHASIIKNGSAVPIVKEKLITYESRPEESEKSLPHPLFFTCFIAFIAAGLTTWDYKRKKASAWFDIILFGLTGLIGLVLLLLWFFTNHKAAAWNFNLLWAVPLNLIAATVLRKQRRWLTRYFLIIGAVALLTLISWPILPQMLHYALIPLVVAVSLGAFLQFYLRKQQTP